MKSDDGFDIYERRRIKLQELVDSYGSQKALSEKVGIAESVISRMLYPAGKKHKRNIGEKSVSMIEESLQLPRGTFDGIVRSTTTTPDEIEFVGKMRLGSVPVVGEAILGVDGMIDMVEIRAGWLQIYSSDKDAYGLKVKGDSMHPRIQSGEFVVIEPNTHIHSGDEVFVRTLDGHNMIKVMTKTRDGSYQFSSINNEHKPITLDPNEVEKMHFVSAIVKATRYVDYDEVQSKGMINFNPSN
ncbi:putative repressor CI from bacteriophage origin [Yersinia pseudotuberculosis]|uniref:S24 family peptidase n=1 Tax=Yersinia TaxID=629 RepID=UPI00061CBB28|nr:MULTISPECIES: S24 family peptidase [Yersinia]QKJ12218.1 LexA family transcriptional regulator [Yersinia massiliensis]CNI97084.1 putative repressor CI from bacteriophage origin [Yersinia pseudotuberculosis]